MLDLSHHPINFYAKGFFVIDWHAFWKVCSERIFLFPKLRDFFISAIQITGHLCDDFHTTGTDFLVHGGMNAIGFCIRMN